MAEEDLGAWDDEDFTPQDLKITSAMGEEVVRKLNEEEEKKAEAVAAAAAASQPKEKTKKQKPKDKADKEGSAEVVASKQLTPQEIEDLQRRSDLAAAADTFGISLSNSSSEDIGDRFRITPKSKEDFDSLVSLLSKTIGNYPKNEHYYDFLSNLFTDLCVKLDSEHTRRYAKELSALGAEKLKEEKEKEKQKQPKSKKKPTLVSKKVSELEDVVGEGQEFNDYGDDDDFM